MAKTDLYNSHRGPTRRSKRRLNTWRFFVQILCSSRVASTVQDRGARLSLTVGRCLSNVEVGALYFVVVARSHVSRHIVFRFCKREKPGHSHPAYILLVNGIASIGKGTVAKARQTVLSNGLPRPMRLECVIFLNMIE